jgi:actin-like ATPase involved in cell morphogenesis
MGYRLGVDLGTTFTAAAVDDGTSPAMLGLGNRALTVPSVVFLSPDGTFLFGEAAERRATRDPSRSAREFKRRIGDTVPILLDGQPFSPQALSARLLAWVVSIATTRQGSAPDEVVVTYPANWGGYKRELLHQIVTLADLPAAITCTEPEAAATQYSSRAGLSPGDRVAVYDLGGGTFDVCVLEKTTTGFTILGSPDGVEHLGGIDVDEAVFQYVVGMLADRLSTLDPDDPSVVDTLGRLRRDCVEAKEALSSDVETTVAVSGPGLTTSLRLTRPELEGLITSPLRDTLDATRRALRSANLTAAELTAVVLVGGSSRIPLVSHLLQSEFGVRTALDTHPKHDIALGAVQYHPTSTAGGAPAAADTVAQWPTRGRPEPTPAVPQVSGGGTPTTLVTGRAVSEAETAAPEATPDAPPEGGTGPPPERGTGPPPWQPPGSGDRPPADPGTSDGATRWPPSRPVYVTLAAALVLIVLGGLAIVGWQLATDPGDGSAAGASGSSATPTSSGGTASPVPRRVVPRNVLLVPIRDEATGLVVLHRISATSGRDLGRLSTSTAVSETSASQSPRGDLVTYRSRPDADTPYTLVVTDAQGTRSSLLPERGPGRPITCQGRTAWDPTRDRVGLVCYPDRDRDGLPDPDTVPSVFTGAVDATGHVRGNLRFEFGAGTPDTEGNASPGSTISEISFLPSGALAVTYEEGELPGVRVMRDGRLTRLTAGTDGDPVAAPEGNVIAFTRDGDLYLVTADGTEPRCPDAGTATVDAVTSAPLCNLTNQRTGPPRDMVSDPAWSWDGRRIGFLVGTGVDALTSRELRVIDVDDPTTVQSLGTAVMGAPAWGRR